MITTPLLIFFFRSAANRIGCENNLIFLYEIHEIVFFGYLLLFSEELDTGGYCISIRCFEAKSARSCFSTNEGYFFNVLVKLI